MHPFSNPWKYQKTYGALGTTGLILHKIQIKFGGDPYYSATANN